MNNNLENKDILSDDILLVIDKVLETCPNVVFGGSIALCGVGLLNRKISDIDLFFPDKDSLVKSGIFSLMNTSDELKSEDVYYNDITDVNGNIIKRIGISVGNVHVCCFIVSSEDLKCSILKFNRNGKEYSLNIQNASNAIEAKKSYSSKTNKHKEDLKHIYDVLNKHFSPNNNDELIEKYIIETLSNNVTVDDGVSGSPYAVHRFSFVDIAKSVVSYIQKLKNS